MLHSGYKDERLAPRVLKEPICHHPNTAEKQAGSCQKQGADKRARARASHKGRGGTRQL